MDVLKRNFPEDDQVDTLSHAESTNNSSSVMWPTKCSSKHSSRPTNVSSDCTSMSADSPTSRMSSGTHRMVSRNKVFLHNL